MFYIGLLWEVKHLQNGIIWIYPITMKYFEFLIEEKAFALALDVSFKQSSLRPMSRSLPAYSVRSFIVSSLMFKSWIHFEWIFVDGVTKWSGFISFFFCFCCWIFPTIHPRDCSFSTVYFWLLCHKLIDQICLGLFLGFLFCFIYLCVFFYADTMLF